MIGFIIWLIGLICCIWCIKDVWAKTSISTGVKIVLIIALLIFSWIGLAVYYFILRKMIK